MTTVPDWMRPPRPDGWYAEDLDHLPDAPRHIELIDGVLIPRPPQLAWHSHVVTALTVALMKQAPDGIEVTCTMTVRLDSRNRPEPDVLVTTAPYEPDRTCFQPEDLLLIAEVVSPESAHRDRTVKLGKYAEAEIRHYWRMDHENWSPVVHVYELEPTGVYAPVGIFRQTLHRPVPFEITLDLDAVAHGELD